MYRELSFKKKNYKKLNNYEKEFCVYFKVFG